MKVLRKIIQIDEERCDGCGQCILSCAEGALAIVDGKAKVIADRFCDGLGACLSECPQNALKIIERQADDFDEEAVEEHLKNQNSKEDQNEPKMACGCPSSQIMAFVPNESAKAAGQTGHAGSVDSTLSHWPIKIRLVPPSAPFLKNADLLVLADCTATAYPSLHQDYLAGKAVMMGCPKFDEVQDYITKFAQIFSTANIRSVTTIVMEVPCCSGMPVIVKKGLEASGQKIPFNNIVIGRTGKVLETQKLN